MQVFVDDRQIDEGIIEGRTLGDALRHLQSALMTPQRVVAGVRCDGEPIAAEDLAASLNKPLAEFHRVDVVTSTKEALVIDVMTHAETSLEESEEQSQRVAELLVQGRSVDAREALADCLRSWQQIHDAVAKCIGMLGLDAEGVMIRDEPLIEAIGKPRGVLLQIKEALVAGDEVLLADILQYEFAEVTQTWHAIIARLRRQAEDLRDQS